MRIRAIMGGLVAVVLVAGIGANIWHSVTARADANALKKMPQDASDIEALLTRNPAASISTLSVADARRVLRANDFVYKKFSDGRLSFEIYVARWKAGNMFAGEAVEHPPDICWTERAGVAMRRVRGPWPLPRH